MEKISQNYHHLLPDMVPWLTLSGSNYPCLEQISMVPKMFEPLKFDCSLLVGSCHKKYGMWNKQTAKVLISSPICTGWSGLYYLSRLGEGGMLVFLLFLHCHSLILHCFCLFSPLSALLSFLSHSLEGEQNDPQGLTYHLILNKKSKRQIHCLLTALVTVEYTVFDLITALCA